MAPEKSGPGYTLRNLPFWSGLLFGTIVTYGVIAQFFEVHRLLHMLGAFAGGAACGFLADAIFVAVTKQVSPGEKEPGSSPPSEEPKP